MFIRKELTLKLDFVKWEFEIGWIWILIEVPYFCSLLCNLF